ncbi:MAG: hypothetical protein K2W78_03520 [Xanthobacteraceae bacterium]|nr:hypothetical protein [Xanthobacteraceae bacterium]
MTKKRADKSTSPLEDVPKRTTIDPDDAPELTAEMLEHAEIREGSVILRPAKSHGPLPKTGKDF